MSSKEGTEMTGFDTWNIEGAHSYLALLVSLLLEYSSTQPLFPQSNMTATHSSHPL